MTHGSQNGSQTGDTFNFGLLPGDSALWCTFSVEFGELWPTGKPTSDKIEKADSSAGLCTSILFKATLDYQTAPFPPVTLILERERDPSFWISQQTESHRVQGYRAFVGFLFLIGSFATLGNPGSWFLPAYTPSRVLGSAPLTPVPVLEFHIPVLQWKYFPRIKKLTGGLR